MLSPQRASGWQAHLKLGFERNPSGGTTLRQREHQGPLRVQKALYPEGPAVCHAIVLHPPSGIAGGDQLLIDASVGGGAHALLTTPGAGKWYRSAGAQASQQINFHVAADACLEWLPQETIVFDGALARMENHIRLSSTARYIGWEVLCLGRRASGERFSNGMLKLATRIERDGSPLWLERANFAGGSPLMDSPVGLDKRTVCATMLATGTPFAPDLLAACRKHVPSEEGGRCGISVLPDLLIARYLGDSSESAHLWLNALWKTLRPPLLGIEAHRPRIWNT